jgi:hypothetical protein
VTSLFEVLHTNSATLKRKRKKHKLDLNYKPFCKVIYIEIGEDKLVQMAQDANGIKTSLLPKKKEL